MVEDNVVEDKVVEDKVVEDKVVEDKDKVVNEEDKIGNKDETMNRAMREDCQMLQSESEEGWVEMGEKKGVTEEGLVESTRQDLLSDSATSTCQCFICPRPASVKCPGCDLVACCLQHLVLHRLDTTTVFIIFVATYRHPRHSTSICSIFLDPHSTHRHHNEDQYLSKAC